MSDQDDRRSELVTLLRRRRHGLPLTATQEGMWLAEQVEPGGSGYHDSIVLEVEGPLDVAALGLALRDLTRHEALRCRVESGDGVPVQFFDADPPPLRYEEIPAGPGDTAVRRRLALAAGAPFDLPAGPLWRALLLRTGAGGHVLAVVLHHLVTDGASHPVLMRTLFDAYAARVAGGAPSLPAPPSYRDWLRAKVAKESDVRDERVTAAAARIAALPRRWELPGLDPAGGGRVAERFDVDVDDQAWSAFGRACRRLGATPFMALAGLFGALLTAESAGPEVVMSAPVANRVEPWERELVGCLIDVVPVRVSSGPAPAAADAVHNGRRAVLAALAHADVPYRRLARAVAAPTGVDDPLTNIGLEEFNIRPSPHRVAGLRVTPMPRDLLRLRHDLTLSVPVAPDARPVLLAPARRWAPGRVTELATGLARLIQAVPA